MGIGMIVVCMTIIALMMCNSKGSKNITNIADIENITCRTYDDEYMYVVSEVEVDKRLYQYLYVFDKDSDYSSYTPYRLNGSINDITAKDNKVYCTSTKYLDDNVSYVDVYENDSGMINRVDRIDITGIILSNIDVIDEKIYGYGFNYNDRGKLFSQMYIINSMDMTICKTIDISDYIIDVTDSIIVDNKLYIAGRSSMNDRGEEVDNKNIIVMDVEDYSMNKIYIGDISNELLYKAGVIYISNYDKVLDEGNCIYGYNMVTEEIKKHIMGDKVDDIVKTMRNSVI